MTARSIHGHGMRRAAVAMGQHAVLLVDSARDNRAMYAEFLRASGFHPIEIDNTSDALALAVTADAVVTGIRVAGPFDGLQLVRCLRADDQTRSKPVIVLTACAFHEDERRARDAGCDVFLAKPCLPAMLAEELRRVLAMRLPRARPVRATRTRATRDIA
jgi:two-component system, cell cycle response regulator DivK